MAPAARAVEIASRTIEAAPFPDPVFPPRSRMPASTGAEWRVLIVVANGERPLRSTCFPEILVCPNPAPCLAWPYTGRTSESMSR